MIEVDISVSVARQAHLLGISRGSVYYTPRAKRASDDGDVIARVRELAASHPGVGSRVLCRLMRERGIVVGRKRMLRIMRILEIIVS